MELIILGSSAAIPVKERNLPAIALKFKSEILLFDCGEDLQRAFTEANLKFNKPLKIFISHFHGDHIIGLPGLLFRFGLIDRDAPVWIFGPRDLFLYLFFHRITLGLNPRFPLHVVEIDSENNTLLEYEGLDSEIPISEKDLENNLFYETNYYSLSYTKVDHSVLTFAYAFQEKPRAGKFNPERAKELGIPMSNLWKKLQDGQSIELNGKLIDPIKEGIIGPPRPGIKITYSGDLKPCDSLIKLGKDSDVLIHEATYAKELAAIAEEKRHSTSIDAANAALKMNAKKLILTHFSSRYPDVKLLEQEAKQIFPNTIAAKDQLNLKLR
ncbi:MAG: ribonuclease Z [Promethearchaeota archaeon]